MVCDMLLVVLVAGFAFGWVRGTWTVSRRALSGFLNSRVLRSGRRRRRPSSEPAGVPPSSSSLVVSAGRGASSAAMLRIYNSLYAPQRQQSVRVRGGAAGGMGGGTSTAVTKAARIDAVDDLPLPSFSSGSARRAFRRQGSTTLGLKGSTALGSPRRQGTFAAASGSSVRRQGLSATASGSSVRRQGAAAVAFAKTWSRLLAEREALLAGGDGDSGGGGDGGGGQGPVGEGTEAGLPDHPAEGLHLEEGAEARPFEHQGLRSEATHWKQQLEEEEEVEIVSPTLPCVPTHDLAATHLLRDGAWTAVPASDYTTRSDEDCDDESADDDDDGAAVCSAAPRDSRPPVKPPGRPLSRASTPAGKPLGRTSTLGRPWGRTSTLKSRPSGKAGAWGGAADEQEDEPSSRGLAPKGKFASILKSRCVSKMMSRQLHAFKGKIKQQMWFCFR